MADKGVIIEFDFAAMDGATLLFDTAKKFFKNLDGIAFRLDEEARYFAGKDLLPAMTGFFAAVKTKKTAVKATRDLKDAFSAALTEAVPNAVTVAFSNFVKALVDAGVKVVIATRADVDKVAPAFAGLVGENVVLCKDQSPSYGFAKWDSWRRSCVAAELSRRSTIAITGSGYGVKAALIAGLGSVAVANEHVAYQDFGGADAVLPELSGKTARKLLETMRIG